MVTLGEIKNYLSVKDNSKDDYFTSMIPVVTSFIEKETGLDLTANPSLVDDTLKFMASKIIEFFMLKSGVKAKAISRMNTTYSEELPSYITSTLERYKETTDPSAGGWSFI
ncbi:phage head-tail connector protein [Pseudobacillus sp. 179-B 2D1 NHS]|uniref:phage head-tail connector protein n=1 Tax=Pseudobacillus TaxID=108525 RepID=UPI000597A4B1|nr:phage head-tail connector protein [Bacillus badius]KIL74363.1 hypothetical protein SD78_1432 [Bacillus badius]